VKTLHEIEKQDLSDLFYQDEHAWYGKASEYINNNRVDMLNLEQLKDILESMARRDKHALYSNLLLLIHHLLKWQYQPQRNTGDSWIRTIVEQRSQIDLAIMDSKNLRKYLCENFSNVYAKARKHAAIECQLPLSTFPEVSPFTLQQVLDEDYFPNLELQ
jgi:hypothetical protein